MTSSIVQGQIEALLLGATIRRLNVEEIRALEVAFPPAQEQESIASETIAQTSRFDELISEALVAIGLLGERRSALISAAVTGKIDVRGLA